MRTLTEILGSLPSLQESAIWLVVLYVLRKPASAKQLLDLLVHAAGIIPRIIAKWHVERLNGTNAVIRAERRLAAKQNGNPRQLMGIRQKGHLRRQPGALPVSSDARTKSHRSEPVARQG
jgi:hypothetical protein